ncbi:hypothetical protein LJC36_03970 [Desulfovibrio sp. OttesenSCG-928-C14]|nr:hypothetical protein [Desulfovibrio sp. OttesenSCG-928-C14]
MANQDSPQDALQGVSLPRRLLRLGIGLLALYLIIFVLAPLPIKYFPPMRHYSEQADKYNIHPGALYYSDVPITPEAERNNRDAVHYFYNKPMQDAAQ